MMGKTLDKVTIKTIARQDTVKAGSEGTIYHYYGRCLLIYRVVRQNSIQLSGFSSDCLVLDCFPFL
jgi:hypothetical protein